MELHILTGLFFLWMMARYVHCTDSATSDYGKFQMRASGADAYIYFSDEIDMRNKLHIMVSVPNCRCVGAVDVQKINQFDYLAMKKYLYSFATYVHYEGGVPIPAPHCQLNAAEIQDRTALEFNSAQYVMLSPPKTNGRRQEKTPNVTITLDSFLSGVIPVSNVPVDDYSPQSTMRIEGLVLLNGIIDYMMHSFVISNRHKILNYEGGFLLMQGNVQLRPCTLDKTTAWMLNDYGQRQVIRYSEKSSAVKYYSKDDATLMTSIIAKMMKEGVLTEANVLNLQINNGASSNLATFPFQALYIPYKDADYVVELLDYFVFTQISPFIYLPFIFQVLWIEDVDWHYYTRADNLTLRVGEPLLKTCDGGTISDTVKNANIEAANALYYYAFSGCSSTYDVEYIVTKAKLVGVYLFYKVAFFIMITLIGIAIIYCIRRWIIITLCCIKEGIQYHRLPNQKDIELQLDKPDHNK